MRNSNCIIILFLKNIICKRNISSRVSMLTQYQVEIEKESDYKTHEFAGTTICFEETDNFA